MYASLLISTFYSILPLWYSMVPSTLSFIPRNVPSWSFHACGDSGSGECSGFSSLCCSSYGSLLISLLVAGLQYLLLTSIIALLQAKFSSSVMAWGEWEREWSQVENRDTPWEVGKQTMGPCISSILQAKW